MDFDRLKLVDNAFVDGRKIKAFQGYNTVPYAESEVIISKFSTKHNL